MATIAPHIPAAGISGAYLPPAGSAGSPVQFPAHVGISTALAGYISDGYDSTSYSSSDEDAEMSDGGVDIGTNNTNVDQLNMEMDMVDAELMGPYNVAAIATNATVHPDHSQIDAGLEGFSEYGLEGDTAELVHGTLDEAEHQLSHPEPVVQDQVLGVAQQLQHIQEVQDHGMLATSAQVHGSLLSHSIHSFSSTPQPVWPQGNDQDGLPYLHDVSSPTAYHSGATTAAAGSLMGGNIAGQGVDHAHLSSDVDWGGEWDSEGDFDDDGMAQANALQVDDQQNLTLGGFLHSWNYAFQHPKKNKPVPNLAHLEKMRLERLTEIVREDLHNDDCDFQGISWTKLEVSRRHARRMRNSSYTNYTNLKSPVWHDLTLRRSVISDPDNFFRFRKMDFRHKIRLSHFQLRNLLACPSRSNICYSGISRVFSINPLFDQKAIRMDLTDPVVQTAAPLAFNGIQISTIAADHNVLIAGGFAGEYGMARLDSPVGTAHVEGIITTDPNPITNHVKIHLNRHSGLPQAAFASNDNSLRILDCTTNEIVAHHKYDYAINCSAISPDHRLRVMVGDHRNVMICDAEKGEVLQDLAGHVDYGFACAWADNGWHVATGNQDKLVKIWDARMWTDQQGVGKPVETISVTVAGARSLKFSPLGSGKRVLIAAESADLVSVIDGETFKTKQTLDFFGEICGVDFTPDGQSLFVGIHDPMKGGIMEFERCGFGQLYGLKENLQENPASREYLNEADFEEQAAGFDWKKTNEEIVRDPRSMRSTTHRRRKAARSGEIGSF